MVKIGPIEMDFERETPNTIRYKENVADDERGVIGTIYILKAALKGTPKSVKVTVDTGP